MAPPGAPPPDAHTLGALHHCSHHRPFALPGMWAPAIRVYVCAAPTVRDGRLRGPMRKRSTYQVGCWSIVDEGCCQVLLGCSINKLPRALDASMMIPTQGRCTATAHQVGLDCLGISDMQLILVPLLALDMSCLVQTATRSDACGEKVTCQVVCFCDTTPTLGTATFGRRATCRCAQQSFVHRCSSRNDWDDLCLELVRKQTNTNTKTNKQTNERTNKRTNEQTNNQTNWQTSKQTSTQTNKPTNPQSNKQTNKQTNEQANK